MTANLAPCNDRECVALRDHQEGYTTRERDYEDSWTICSFSSRRKRSGFLSRQRDGVWRASHDAWELHVQTYIGFRDGGCTGSCKYAGYKNSVRRCIPNLGTSS